MPEEFVRIQLGPRDIRKVSKADQSKFMADHPGATLVREQGARAAAAGTEAKAEEPGENKAAGAAATKAAGK